MTSDHRLAGDGDGVEREGEQAEHGEGDLVGGDLGRPDPGGHGGGEGERPAQRERPDQQVAAGAGESADGPPVRSERTPTAADRPGR